MPDTAVAEAVHLIWDGDCGILPVVDEAVLVGVVTDRDMYIALRTPNALRHAAYRFGWKMALDGSRAWPVCGVSTEQPAQNKSIPDHAAGVSMEARSIRSRLNP